MLSPGAALRRKILVLTGPTGVGKTELSLRLAERLRGEIISADSVQVYRGLNVGSDKVGIHVRSNKCLNSNFGDMVVGAQLRREEPPALTL